MFVDFNKLYIYIFLRVSTEYNKLSFILIDFQRIVSRPFALNGIHLSRREIASQIDSALLSHEIYNDISSA